MATGGASEENLSLYLNTDDGVTINGVSSVTTADVEVDNGIVHAADAVNDLPGIVTFALADPQLENLIAVLTREDDFPFVEVLMETGPLAPFTVFAPTNDAFVALLGEVEMEGLEDIPAEVLASTLSYHVVIGANLRSSDLQDGMEVSTLAEDSFTINLGEAL